jgi:hypothetical protein
MTRTAGDLALLATVFAGTTALAELFGATNMGTALTFGELAFSAALIWILLRER